MKRLIFLITLELVLSSFAIAANQVGLTVHGLGGGDTLWAAQLGWFEISIANDAQIWGGIQIGFIISGTAEYDFIDVPDGFIPSDSSLPKYVRGIPGSRWMTGEADDGSCWDLGGTQVNGPTDNYPNQFLIGGATLSSDGLAPGPLQPMLEVHYALHPVPLSQPRQFCIDSMKYGSAGDFIFVPGGTPEVLWGSSPLCFVVLDPGCLCPQWDDDNPTSMTVKVGNTGQVVLSATDPCLEDVYYYLVGIIGGAGTATVGLHDGVVSYTPAPVDVGAEIEIRVEATNPMFQQGGCLYYARTIDVTVTPNHPPAIDCGNPYNMTDYAALFKKFDIVAVDSDACDEIQFNIASVSPVPVGTYSIDPATGIVSFLPDPYDVGMQSEFCVEAFDGIDATSCCFHIEVCNCEDYAGDADGSGEVNVGDAVMLIYYIFKGSGGPVNMNWADVNADCAVNVADAVYLIDYIFKDGPEPQVGCYY